MSWSLVPVQRARRRHRVEHSFPPPLDLPIWESPATKRERADARRNRERILCAARHLILEDGGIDDVSMDDVAAAAGVGKGTLYRRFGDRSSLLRALIEEPERAFQDELIRGLPPLGPGAPPQERLHAFGAAYLAFLDGHAALLKASEWLKRGDYYLHPVYGFYRTHVLVLLRQAIGGDPALDDATIEYLADALMGPLGAAPFLHHRQDRGMSLAQLQGSWCRLVDALLSSRPRSER